VAPRLPPSKSTAHAAARRDVDHDLSVRPVLHVIGWVTAFLGLMMLVPASVDWTMRNPDWQVFAVSAGVTAFCGVALVLANEGSSDFLHLSLQQGFLLTTGLWIAAAIAGSLPLAFSELDLHYADAFFESMSGITTTGSTVLVGIDAMPPGIVLWRCMLQGLGGIGFVAASFAMLPFLRVGGMQLFRLESSERSDKVVPQAKRFVVFLLLIYSGLIVLCVIAYALAGMTFFEAVCHGLTTVATGGYSTSDASLGHFDSAAIEWIGVVFMLAGSMPFILYMRVLQGRPGYFWRDEQVHSFLRFVALASAGLAVWLWIEHEASIVDAIRVSVFNIVSVVTTTGYATTDYNAWGSFAIVAFFLLTFVGGCSGSTAGGLKAFRFDMLAKAIDIYVRRLLFPHGTFVATYNRRPVTDDVFAGVLMFMGVYLLTVAAVSAGLALMGLDALTSISGAATAVGNVGPGLGDQIGPAGNFAALPDGAKWLLSFAMLLGRLELFSVLALFAPRFWKA
jgi:trk system potassium uptake protein TrkH